MHGALKLVIFMTDSEGYILEWNRSCYHLTGYENEEAKGRHWFILLGGDQSLLMVQSLLSEARRNGCMSSVILLRTKSQHTIKVNVSVLAVHEERTDSGKFIVAIDEGQMNSFTERADFPENLYQRMVGEIQDFAIVFLNETGDIQTWNAGAQAIKGYNADEVIGRNFSIFYTEEERAAGLPFELLQKAKINGFVKHEGWRVRKSGERFWGNVVISAIHNSDGKLIGFAKVTSDATVRKSAETDRLRYIESLESRALEMRQLAYIASHDLQEPLRTMKNFITRLQPKDSIIQDEDSLTYLNIISLSVDRMQQLVNAILEYAVLGFGRVLTKIDCNLLLDEVKQDLSDLICNAGADLNIGPLPVLKGYVVELRQLFQNLIENALKFRRADIACKISVGAYRDKDSWVFYIKDNGLGIDSIYREKIFYLFQRVPNRGKYSGTGIGLAYCKKIIELHGGRIWVESEVGEGSVFYVLVPDL